MAAGEPIKSLRERKEELIAENADDRERITQAWQGCKQAVVRWRPQIRWPQSVPPAVWVAVPVAGVLFGRRLLSARGFWVKAVVVWQLIRRAHRIQQIVKRFLG